MPIRLWTGQACAAPLSVRKNFMIPACLAAAVFLPYRDAARLL
ncbi:MULTISPECIES: hypothetical protein [Ruminococcus]|nr:MULTISPECIES: hypothetical protein [Ruminococcus]MEE1398766.1 hypothetical protein [Ruminococcus sp.]